MTALNSGRPALSNRNVRPSGPPQSQSFASSIDPIRVIRRHILGITLSTMIGAILGAGSYFVLLKTYPLFSGEVLFELRPGIQDPTKVGVVDVSRDDLIERLARTQTVLLTSREVLVKAMEDPAIKRNTEWHKKFVSEDGVFDIQEAVDELEEDLGAPVIRGTNLFALRWATHRKNDVPIVLNAITQAYEFKRKSLDESSLNENNRVFVVQKMEIESSLRDIEARITQFIREKGMTSVDDARYSQEALKLQNINDTLNDSRVQLSFSQSNYAQVQAKLEGTMEPSHDDKKLANENPRMITMNLQVDEKRTKQREMNRRYRPDHIEVITIEKEVRAAEEERDQAHEEIIQEILLALQKTTSDEIESLEALLTQYEEDAEDVSLRLQELTAAYNVFVALDTQRKHLEEDRQSKVILIGELTLMRMRADANRVRVAQPAIPPREPSFPKIEYVLPLGVLLSMGLTIGWIFFRELTDSRIKSASDLSIMPGATVLGSIPDLEDDPTRTKSVELVVREHPASILAESYRQACSAMNWTVEQNGYQSLVFFSAMPSAGNTTAITNFACVLSAMGKSVCVIDADFRRPRLANAFGLDPDHLGFGDLLGDLTDLSSVIQQSDGIDVISAGTATERVIERLATSRMSNILTELRSRYDMILFDSPPAVVAGDVMSVANYVDAAVMVVRANREQRGLVARLVGQFNKSSCNLIGLVLNRPLSSAGGYYKKNYAVMAKYSLSKTG